METCIGFEVVKARVAILKVVDLWDSICVKKSYLKDSTSIALVS